MRSAGRSDFVRVLPWVTCLALGAAAHLVWVIDAWWGPTPSSPHVVVQVAAPVATPATVVLREQAPHVRRTETAGASDPELVAMLVDAHVHCDDDATCTIDPRLVDYLLADPRRRGQLVLEYEHDGEPRSLQLHLHRIPAPRARAPRDARRHNTGRRAPGRLAGRPRAIATSASP